MVRRLGLGKNNHLTYASLALNPRYPKWFCNEASYKEVPMSVPTMYIFVALGGKSSIWAVVIPLAYEVF